MISLTLAQNTTPAENPYRVFVFWLCSSSGDSIIEFPVSCLVSHYCTLASLFRNVTSLVRV